MRPGDSSFASTGALHLRIEQDGHFEDEFIVHDLVATDPRIDILRAVQLETKEKPAREVVDERRSKGGACTAVAHDGSSRVLFDDVAASFAVRPIIDDGALFDDAQWAHQTEDEFVNSANGRG